MAATDAHGDVTFINPAAEYFTGVRQADANGKSLVEIFSVTHDPIGADPAGAVAARCNSKSEPGNPVAKALEINEPVHFNETTLLVGKKGRTIPIDGSVMPMRNGDGAMEGLV